MISGKKRRSVQSFSPDEITQVERNEHPDGLGDVTFGKQRARKHGNTRLGLRTDNEEKFEPFGFFGIADAREVEEEVAKLRRSADAVAAD